MTEHDTALAFDRALDGERGISLNGSESLVLTAHAMQTLFARQQESPTEEFVMQLEQTLFGLPVVPSGVEGPPAGAVSRSQPTPRPAPIHPNRTRTFPRWAAIAAALILLFGGAGVISLGPFDLHSTPEPSSIPAIGFGTVEASPEPVGALWTVDPMPGTSIPVQSPVISNGIAFQTSIGSTSPIQAVDLQTGTVLWSGLTRVAPYLATGVDDLLIIAGGNGNSAGFRFELVALGGRTGDEVWSEALSSKPVGLRVLGDQIIVLGGDNLLESFDLQTHERRWQTDLSRFVDSMGENDGLNRFTDLDSDRLAVVDGVIGALLSNGRLIAVDASDGRLRWSDTRRSSGWTRLRVVDEKFVVLAFGSGVLVAEPVATPEPFAPFDPSVDPCVQTLRSRSGSVAEVPPVLGETVDLFDPDTGASAWGVTAEESYSIAPTDDGRLIVQIGPGWESSIANNNEDFTCAIDGATGAVSETTGRDLVTFVIPGSEPGEFAGIGVLPGGAPVWIDSIDPETAASLPYFDSDPAQFSGFRWVQKADGLILITAQDGTLLGFSASSPNRAAATPIEDSATPVSADVVWKVNGPEIAGGWLGDQTIDDEHLYLSYETGTTKPGTILAVDLETGATAWSIPAPVSVRVMEVSGDLLLVAGLDKSTGGAYRMIAVDTGTGEAVWNVPLRGAAVALSVVGERILMLSQNNTLQAYALDSGEWISTTDIGGRSKPTYTVMYMGNRLTIIDQTLVAVLADGSVAGVDLETGVAKWWALRGTPGETMVLGVDGNLIVRARPDADLSAAGFGESATPAALASPVAIASPGAVSCQSTVHLALPQATIDGDGLEQGETMIMRLNLDDGTTIWNARSDQLYYPDLVSSAGLLSVATAGQAWPTDRSEIALCVTDPSTGQVSTVERMADVAQQTARLTFTSTEDQQVYEVILGIDGAESPIVLPLEFDPSVQGPVVDSTGMESFGLFYQDGALYFALDDGQIMKVVLPTDS